MFDSYEVSAELRSWVGERLAGVRAGDGSVRYASTLANDRRHPAAGSGLRRSGYVTAIDGNEIRIVIPGVTDDEGDAVPFPSGMPGWLCRVGATFDVVGADDSLEEAIYRYQAASFLDDEDELLAAARQLQDS